MHILAGFKNAYNKMFSSLGDRLKKKWLKILLLLSILLFIVSFQNCSTRGFETTLSQKQNSSAQVPLNPELRLCSFNGVIYKTGETVTAFLSSSVSVGATCISEKRICQVDGIFSGSYLYSQCQPGAAKACLFNNSTIPSGQSVDAYESASVAFGSQCVKQSRNCQNGALSGSYLYSQCQPGAAKACLFNNSTIPSGQSVDAYESSSVAFGSQCVKQSRNCQNGTLSGSYLYSQCQSPEKLQLVSSTEIANAQHVKNFDAFDQSRAFIIARHLTNDVWNRPITESMKPELPKKTLYSFNPTAGVIPDSPAIQTFLPSYIQHKGDEIGFYISLFDLKMLGAYTAVRGGGPHMTLGKKFSYFPWQKSSQVLHMQTDAAMSSVETNGNLANRPYEQLSFIFYLKEKTSGVDVAFVYGIFEPRGNPEPTVQNDTYVDFISAPLASSSSAYLTVAGGSQIQKNSPSSLRERYHFEMTSQHVVNAVTALNKKRVSNNLASLSTNAADYELTEANVFFELPNFVEGVWTNAGVSIKGFDVWVQK